MTRVGRACARAYYAPMASFVRGFIRSRAHPERRSSCTAPKSFRSRASGRVTAAPPCSGKKGHALRIASYQARTEVGSGAHACSGSAEPEGETHDVAAGVHIRVRKKNMAMLISPGFDAGLERFSRLAMTSVVAITERTGRLWRINPEAGLLSAWCRGRIPKPNGMRTRRSTLIRCSPTWTRMPYKPNLVGRFVDG